MKKNNFDWVLTQCENYSKKELIEEIYYKCEQIEGKNKKIDQLTNNWNELEEIILKEIEKCEEDEKIIRQNKIPKFYDIGVCAGIHGTCKFILNKMNEIKEGE